MITVQAGQNVDICDETLEALEAAFALDVDFNMLPSEITAHRTKNPDGSFFVDLEAGGDRSWTDSNDGPTYPNKVRG